MKKHPILLGNYVIAALIMLVSLISCSKQETVEKNGDKSISSFSFTGINTVISGQINEVTKTITVTVPAMTDIRSLSPDIAVSAKADISPKSGVVQDFSNPVNYTVTAEDGSQQVYRVLVTRAPVETLTLTCDNVPAVLEDLGEGVDYIVKCLITLKNKTLTIRPGVTIQFEGEEAGIVVDGGSFSGGGLKMVGTAAKPIVLQGKNGVAGSWLGVQINSNNVNNEWEYVTVRDAGAGAYSAGLLLTNGSSIMSTPEMQVSIKHCSFINNKGYGIWDYENGYPALISIFSEFKNNAFQNNSKSALRLKIGSVGSLDATSAYQANTQKYIEVTSSRSGLQVNTTVVKLDVPYFITGGISIRNKMTIMPGVEFLFAKDTGFGVYSEYKAGTIIANGTAAEPIKFKGFEPGKGYWFGIELQNPDPQLVFNHCIIDGAGSIPSEEGCAWSKKSAVTFAGRCAEGGTGTLTNCTISNSGGYGIIYKQGKAVNLSGNTFSGNTSLDIFINP